MEKEENKYKKQYYTTLINFLMAGVFSLGATIILFLSTRSILFLVQVVGSINSCIVLGLYCYISRKLMINKSFEYEYGLDKHESIGTLFGYIIQDANLLILIGVSVNSLLHPSNNTSFGFFSYYYTLSAIVLNFCMYMNFRQQYKKYQSDTVKAQQLEVIKNTVIKIIYFVAMLLITIMPDALWVYQFQYIISIAVILYILYVSWRPLHDSIYRLLDRCADEKTTTMIVSTLAKKYELYDEFFTYRTRMSGNRMFVDIYLNYDEDMTVAEMTKRNREIIDAIKEKISGAVVNCIVVENASLIKI